MAFDPTDPKPRRRSAGFFWGLTLGLLGALAVVVSGDMGWTALPLPAGRPAAAEPGASAEASSATASVYLAGAVPEGMQVFVDGRAVTPVPEGTGSRVPVEPRSRRIEVRGSRGPLWSTPLTGGDGGVDTLRPVLGGDVVVQVDRQAPTGPLYLDDEMAGTAPGTLSDVPPGWHTLSIRNDGNVLFEDAVVVNPGQVTLVSVPPVPPLGKGRVSVRSRLLGDDGLREESGNRVGVDGAPAGSTPLEATLPAGFHSIRVDRPGYDPWVQVVYLEAGRSLYATADFGGDTGLTVEVAPPVQAGERSPVAVPVRVTAGGESVSLEEGTLHVVRPGQARPLDVPLVASGTDRALWVAVLPEGLAATRGFLSGYVTCRDGQGRRGDSEIFSVSLR